MEWPKIAISDAEWQLATTPDFILTKNRIIDGVYELYGKLSDTYITMAQPLVGKFPEAFGVIPKISRGEKYAGMPWVMLDYPRFFSEEYGHFAIRSFFWWGHYFSIQLHVSGTFLQAVLPSVGSFQQQGWYTGFTAEPWNHLLPNPEWNIPTASLDLQSDNQPLFLKVAKKMPIDRWAYANDFFENSYDEIADIL